MKTAIVILLLLLLVIQFVMIHRLSGKNKILSSKISDADTNKSLMNEVYQTRAQIAALQSQINPHFLYNTLESIRSKAILHDEDEIAEMIETLARLFRYNIGKGEQISTIAAELENVENYIKIQNYRFRNKFIFEVDYDSLTDKKDSYPLPMLTLQPLVENAVHHGLENLLDKGTVRIEAVTTEQHFILRIKDNGVGMNLEQLAALREKVQHTENIPKQDPNKRKGSGIALANVNRRLKLFYGEEYGLEVMSAEGVGTTLELLLPINGEVRKGVLQ